VSSAGTIAYYSSPPTNTTATWIDVTGRIAGTLSLPDGQYTDLSISPDGTRAVLVRSRSASESSLWLADLAHGGASPLSSGRGRNDNPVWSPDSSRIVFASDREGPFDFYVKTVSDPAEEKLFYKSPVLFKNPDSWSKDGKWIVYTSLDTGTAQNIWLLPSSGSPTPVPYVRGPLRDFLGTPSPDGRILAYVSDETGRFELYTQAFPEARGKQQISTDGGFAHWWSSDSRDLYYVGAGSSLWRGRMETGGSGRLMPPERLATLPPNILRIDAMPNRQRYLALVNDRVGTGSVTVVQNWRAGLEKKR
jgi:dipeptidyl aminopeptidase/acylaminoacyl peptidase